MNHEPTKIRVVVEYAGESYGAYSPDLPGCVATGDTREEVEANMHKAIEFHIAGMKEDGLLADPEVCRTIEAAEVQISRGGGLSFKEAFGEAQTSEDRAWMESDLSRLGEYEPYEWAEGELDDMTPVRYEPGRGLWVEGDKRRA